MSEGAVCTINMAANQNQPLKQDQRITNNRFFRKPEKKNNILQQCFWPKMSPALVALQDYFASPLVY